MKCPGCSAELRYDIVSKQMRCDNCSQSYDPYLFDQYSEGAEYGRSEDGKYQTNVWMCPNCGARLTYTGDTDVTTVCAYCGRANIIQSRLKNEKRPDTIIPFTVTKDDCKKAYVKALRRAFLSPRRLMKESQINSFRGIYMPYWEYEAELNDSVGIEYRKGSNRDGDYVNTDIYQIYDNVQGTFTGMSHDASKQFDDDISECIAPYPREAEKPFTPGFLCGFYAETDDDKIKKDYKAKTAEMIAEEIVTETVHAASAQDPKSTLKKYSIDESSISIPSEKIRTKRTLFPVWFMSYRKDDDRMLYATVNGATGKVVADFPISIVRFLCLTLAIAAGVFLLLNLADFMGRPLATFAFTGMLSIFSCWINLKVFARNSVRNEGSRERKSRSFWLTAGLVACLGLAMLIVLILNASSNTFTRIVYIAFGIVFAIIFISKLRNDYRKGDQEWFFALITLIFAGASMIFILFNVKNYIYYCASLLNIALFLVQFWFTVKTHNERAYRRPPQFNKMGGDDHA